MITIADALDSYAADRRPIIVDVARLERAAERLRRSIGDIDIADRIALVGAVGRYTAGRRADGVADATIRRDLIVLRAAVRGPWKRGEMPYPPYVALPAASPGRQRWLTPDEARGLLAQCAGHLRTFVLLALLTGARRSAILELTWDRVDLGRGIIDYRCPHPRAARRKSRAVVPIAPVLRRELERRRPKKVGDLARVVPLAPWQVDRHMRAAREAARLPDVTPHVLRHTAATWMLGDGAIPLPQVSRMLGHRSTLITEQVYAHIQAGHLVCAAELLGSTLEGRGVARRRPSR